MEKSPNSSHSTHKLIAKTSQGVIIWTVSGQPHDHSFWRVCAFQNSSFGWWSPPQFHFRSFRDIWFTRNTHQKSAGFLPLDTVKNYGCTICNFHNKFYHTPTWGNTSPFEKQILKLYRQLQSLTEIKMLLVVSLLMKNGSLMCFLSVFVQSDRSHLVLFLLCITVYYIVSHPELMWESEPPMLSAA